MVTGVQGAGEGARGEGHEQERDLLPRCGVGGEDADALDPAYLAEILRCLPRGAHRGSCAGKPTRSVPRLSICKITISSLYLLKLERVLGDSILVRSKQAPLLPLLLHQHPYALPGSVGARPVAGLVVIGCAIPMVRDTAALSSSSKAHCHPDGLFLRICSPIFFD